MFIEPQKGQGCRCPLPLTWTGMLPGSSLCSLTYIFILFSTNWLHPDHEKSSCLQLANLLSFPWVTSMSVPVHKPCRRSSSGQWLRGPCNYDEGSGMCIWYRYRHQICISSLFPAMKDFDLSSNSWCQFFTRQIHTGTGWKRTQ